jgi:hypothetical protein
MGFAARGGKAHLIHRSEPPAASSLNSYDLRIC